MTDSTLTVFRQSAYASRLRAYRLCVDGKQVESVRNGGTVTVSLTPGTHVIVAQIDWVTSAPLQVTCSDGAPVFIRCETTSDPVELFKAMVKLRHEHIVLTVRDAAALARTSEEQADRRASLPVRSKRAATWLVGCIAVGFVTSLFIANDATHPDVASLKNLLIGEIAGTVGFVGAMRRFLRR